MFVRMFDIQCPVVIMRLLIGTKTSAEVSRKVLLYSSARLVCCVYCSRPVVVLYRHCFAVGLTVDTVFVRACTFQVRACFIIGASRGVGNIVGSLEINEKRFNIS